MDSVVLAEWILNPRVVIIIMDTTYFGRELGLMVFRDWITKKTLYFKFVKYETIQAYKDGIRYLIENGFVVLGIVVDGRRGLFKAFGNIPVQMCQFHQKQIVTRYLTRNPKLEASKELKEIVEILTITDKESFDGLLKEWFEKWKAFLSEKSISRKTGRVGFTHRRLRGAYFSLKRNLPYLFVYQEHLDIGMPNTTNSLEGKFAHMKSKMKAHRGLRVDRKKKLIIQLIS